MNLCIVTHKLVRTDGQGSINAEVAAALAAGGQSVHLWATEVAPELAAAPTIVWHRVAVPAWLPSNLAKYQLFALETWWKLRRLPPTDLVQLNGAITYGTPGGVNVSNFVHADWLASPHHPWRSGRGLNAWYQYVFTRLNAGWERRAYRRAERVVALSDQVRDALVRYVGLSPAAIRVIMPGVDAEQFRPLRAGEPNALRAELGLGPEPLLLLFAGDIRSNRKNLDLVLRAMARLPADVRLAVIGDDARSPYPAMADQLGVGDRVHFLGRRTDDLPALMRGADVFAFPSHYDTFALVVTEAMASGLAVITAPTVGASALIREGESGFVLPDANDLDALVRTITALHADRPRLAAVGAAARATAEGHTWVDMAGQYEQLYREVLTGRTANAGAG